MFFNFHILLLLIYYIRAFQIQHIFFDCVAKHTGKHIMFPNVLEKQKLLRMCSGSICFEFLKIGYQAIVV